MTASCLNSSVNRLLLIEYSFNLNYEAKSIQYSRDDSY